MLDAMKLKWNAGTAAAIGEIPTPDAALRVTFEQMVDTHYKRVYNLLYRLLGNEQDASDLTQETFVRVYRSLHRLRADGAQSAWIRTIATNLALDHLRKRKHQPMLLSLDSRQIEGSDQTAAWDIADPSNEPERVLAENENARLVRAAINTLAPDYKTVIVLHYLDDLGVDSIAATLQVPSGTVKSRLSRARKELKRKIGHLFPG